MPRHDGPAAGVHQQEAAGAVGVLGHAGREAGLAEQGALLVAGDAADQHRRAQQRGAALAVMGAGRQDPGHQRSRDVQQRQQLGVPLVAMHVEQHGARGVGDVGGMQRPFGQLPQQPAVDGAERQLAALRLLARAGHVVQQPADLGGGEIGVDDQAGARLDQGCVALLAQLRAQRLAAAVLPHDRVVDRLPGAAVPQHRGLALVGDAQGLDVAGLQPGALQGLARGRELAAPDLHGVMFHPPGPRVDLRQFLLGLGDDAPLRVEDDAA